MATLATPEISVRDVDSSAMAAASSAGSRDQAGSNVRYARNAVMTVHV